MSVLQLISSSGLYGAERVVLELMAHLQQRGRQPRLGVLRSQDRPVALAEEARRRGHAVVEIPCRGRFDALAMHQIGAYVRLHDVRVVHSHGYKADIFAGMATLPAGVARVSTCHNWLTDSVKLMLFELLDKLVLQRFDRVVAVSMALARELERAGLPSTRRALIENGLDLPPPCPAARQRLREELGLAPDQALVVAVGRLDRWKDHELLLQALARLQPDLTPPPRLLLVGDGELRAELERQAQQLGLEQRVTFAGYRDDVPDLLRSSDLFVISSRKEGAPMVLLEAMAAALPVVSTRVGQIPLLLDNGACGVLVPPGDAAALSHALGQVLTSRDGGQQLARLAQARHEQRYSRQAMGQRYCALYDQLVARGAASTGGLP